MRINQKLAASPELIPAGASAPMVRARSIDDVPVMALTLWGEGYDDQQLRRVAAQLQESIKEVPDVSEVTIIGGRPRQVSVDLDPSALSARGLDPLQVQQALTRATARGAATEVVSGNRSTRVEAGGYPTTARDLAALVVGASGGPVRLGDVAEVADGAGEPGRKDAPEGPPVEFRLTADEISAELAKAGYRLAASHAFLPRQLFLIYSL